MPGVEKDPDMKDLAELEGKVRSSKSRLAWKKSPSSCLKTRTITRTSFSKFGAGAGGEELCRSRPICSAYARYAEKRRFKVTIMSESHASAGGLKEIQASVEGQGAFSVLKFESGVHRVQRVPSTETQTAFTRPQPRWPSCLKPKMSMCTLIPKI